MVAVAVLTGTPAASVIWNFTGIVLPLLKPLGTWPAFLGLITLAYLALNLLFAAL